MINFSKKLTSSVINFSKTEILNDELYNLTTKKVVKQNKNTSKIKIHLPHTKLRWVLVVYDMA